MAKKLKVLLIFFIFIGINVFATTTTFTTVNGNNSCTGKTGYKSINDTNICVANDIQHFGTAIYVSGSGTVTYNIIADGVDATTINVEDIVFADAGNVYTLKGTGDTTGTYVRFFDTSDTEISTTYLSSNKAPGSSDNTMASFFGSFSTVSSVARIQFVMVNSAGTSLSNMEIRSISYNTTPVSSDPAITSAIYNASTGVLVVTGTDFAATAGSANDVIANKFTLTGEGGGTYTLTDTSDVEITSATEFTLTLSSTDKNAVNLLLNNDGTSSTGSTTYNLAGAAGFIAASSSVSDTTGNVVTVSGISAPTLTSATYDASSAVLAITGTNFVRNSGGTNDLDVSKLTLTGENADTYTLTTSSVEVTSTTSASVTLNAIDQLNVHGLLNLNGTSSVSSTTYNLAGAENWMPGHSGTDADTTSNGITVSNVQTPTITSATYDVSTGALVVTGTNLVKANGATNDITVSKLTITGEGSGTKVLTTSDVEITSATSFTVTLSAADKSAVNLILNKNGTSSTDSTTYNLSASDDWNSVIGNTDISDTTNSITVSNVSNPTITSSTYDISTGTLVVTGTNFVSNSGATNDIDITKLSVVGDASASYTLTSSNVEVSNDTSFSVVLNATDQLNVNGLLNKNGTSSGDGTTYNLSAADNWMQGALASNDISDTTGNVITVSNVQIPTITSATYDVSTGILVVTGTNFVKKVGATNDIDVSKLTLTGQGSGTKALTTTNVEINSATSFSVTLTSADKTDVNVLLNKDGLSSVDSVTYNLAAAEDWMSGADASSNIADTSSNAITVSNADNTPPTISSISIANSAMKIGDTISVTITVASDSDDYTGSGAITGTIGGFTLSNLSKTDDTTYTASFTVTSGGSDVAAGSSIPVSFTLKDSAGNISSAYTTAITQSSDSIDANKPTLSSVSISSNNTSSSNAKLGDVITLTFTSSETLSSTPTVTIAGQSASVTNTSGNNYSATYTMQNSDTEGTVNFTIDFSDSAGNTGTQVTSVSDSSSVTFDKTAPVLTDGNISISGASGAYKIGDTITATWNNTAGGDNNSDISSVSVDFSAFGGGNSVSASNSSGTWSASYTITAGNIDTTNLNVSIKAIDDVGNSTTTADTTNATLDNLAPIASITSQKDSMILSEQITITFTLNKESTDFTVDDISVNGGSLSNFVQDSSNTKLYTATLTPDSSLTTSITLDVNATKFTDSVGNNNVASSQKSIIVLPSVLSYSPVLDSTGIALNAKLKLEFSENLVKGTGNIIIKKASDDSILETIDVLSNNVVIENLPSTEVTKTTVTITRSNDFELNTQYYVTIDTNVFKDTENNSYLGISDKVTWKFTSTDNRAPVITNNNGNASATISVDENQTSVIDIEATDADSGQTHVYSLLGTDASLFNINSSTGVVTFKTSPNYEVKNSYSITVKVADNLGGEDTQNLTININNINDDAIINIANSLSTNEDTAKDLTYTYTDEDGDTVTATEKTAPSKGSISISGTTITYTPSANKNGNDSFTLTLSDGNGYSVDKTISVSITAIDDNPTITTDLTNQTQNEDGKGLVINLATSDIDSDSSTATYTASSSDTSIAKAYIRDGKLIVVPVANANGAVTISVTTTVGGLSSTKTFVYTLTSVNDRPTISNIGDISHDQTSSVITKTITFDIWDDVDVTSLTASSSNTNLLANNSITVSKLSSTQGQIVYTISANNAGDTTVTIIARDVESLEYKESFNISVKAANDAQCVENTNTALVFDTIKSNNSYQDSVTSNLGLVNSIDSVCSSSITWASSDTSVIDTSGVVTQASEDKTISITATITKGEFTSTKVFLITVPKGTITDSEAIAKLLFETIKEQNLTKYQITSKLNLVETILGKTITWSSSNDNVISPYSGYVTRTSSDESVTLTATIGSATKNFALTVLKEETSDAQKVEKDKSMLTLASLLDKNIDADNIKYNLIKPLPNTGGNGSTITWATSNSACITIDGDVVRDASSDKYVTLTATINNNGQSDTKEFIFRVLQNKIESNSSTTFKNAVDTASGSQVTTSENGSDVTTQSSFDNSLLSAVEKVISQESVKSILEFVDKVVNVYLNTDGTAQSTLQNSNGQSSSMKVESNGSTTNVDASGNIESSDNTSNGSIKLQLKTDGSVSHEVVNTSSSTTSTATSTIEGSSVEADKDGNVQTTSEVRSNGTLYKIVVSTDNEGKTTTKYVSINTTTGDEVETKNVISPSTPYPSGNSATITEIDGQLYISTTVPLDGQIVIE